MTDVTNANGATIDFEAAVNLMDDEICEALHANGIEDEQGFFAAYEKAHAEKYGGDWELSKANPTW